MTTISFLYDLSDPNDASECRKAISAEGMLDSIVEHYQWVNKRKKTAPNAKAAAEDFKAHLSSELAKRRCAWVLDESAASAEKMAKEWEHPKRTATVTAPIGAPGETIMRSAVLFVALRSYGAKLDERIDNGFDSSITNTAVAEGLDSSLKDSGLHEWVLAQLPGRVQEA